MVKLVSSAGALAADRVAETDFGYPGLLLMEEAGIRLQDNLEKMRRDGHLVPGPTVYLVGPGNNGGDALVMARQAFLRGDTDVSVVLVVPPASESARWQLGVVTSLKLPVFPWPSVEARNLLRASAVWVDGVWGTGLRGPLRSDRQELVKELEAWRAEGGQPCVAVDVPSGLWEGFRPGDPVITATWTLAPGWLKDFCFYPEARRAVGTPVGADGSADLVSFEDLGSLVPKVGAEDHKGRRGHVLVVGGAPGMPGALVLAARSAAASGAGLVTIGTDAALVALVAPQVPAFQVREASSLASLFPRFKAAVIGPGWGRTEDRVAVLKTLWATDLPLVLDADALAAWSGDVAWPPRSAPVVITPHPGEFRRLTQSTGSSVVDASTLAEERRVTVVLKGAVTWVISPDGRRAVWDGANPALGTGGSGDCLAGVVGAFLGLGLGAFEAAQAAVVLHGQAGRDLADRDGWFTADRLPEALARRAAACMAGLGPL